jgi:hypothetical protein
MTAQQESICRDLEGADGDAPLERLADLFQFTLPMHLFNSSTSEFHSPHFLNVRADALTADDGDILDNTDNGYRAFRSGDGFLWYNEDLCVLIIQNIKLDTNQRDLGHVGNHSLQFDFFAIIFGRIGYDILDAYSSRGKVIASGEKRGT